MNANENQQDAQYQVVALRYRPQSFGDLVGQGHIATALSNAINKSRVGHAYLFTGARGVGKTSSARIFAKCLNCEKGPTIEPCNECDICQAVSAGEDVDVLEIDGASNRGIDEIRQLRSNAAVRPGRSKYKIYIIDEVHMLTTQAFNALLKTLEEPPQHVKFIFCTTDPQKIPITVLSRCQRFDFSPVQTNEIANRLKEIAQAEGVEADEQALALLARRANGSMRDSQSLLEQLFSFCGKDISVDEVNQLLGTADMGRIAEIATAMAGNDATATLNLIHRGIVEGVDAGQMADQLLGYFRDMMAVRVGCGEDTLLNCTSADLDELKDLGESLGLETILSIVQLLDVAVVRMQSSLHARTLLEAAAIRVCNLEKLDALSDLVTSLSANAGGGKTKPKSKPAARKPRVQMRQVESPSKKNEVSEAKPGADSDSKPNDDLNSNRVTGSQSSGGNLATAAAGVAAGAVAATATGALQSSLAAESNGVTGLANGPANGLANGSADKAASQINPDSHDSANPDEPAQPDSETVSSDNIESVWRKVATQLGGMTSEMACDFESLVLEKPDKLVVTLNQKIGFDMCSRADKRQKFESALEAIAGTRIRVDFLASKKAKEEHKPVPKLTRQAQIRKLHDEGFVKKAISLFDAEITGYQEPLRTRKR